MPGFVVGVPGGTSGGAGSRSPSSTDTEYIYTYTWEIINIIGDSVTSSDKNALIHVKDLSLPTFTANTDSYQGASLEYKWAKSVVWEDINIKWYDTVGLIKVIKEWRESVWTPEFGLAAGNDYKRESQIDVYPPDWNNNKKSTWKLHNSWPKIIKHGELTYTNSDVKLIEVVLAYDFADEVYKLP